MYGMHMFRPYLVGNQFHAWVNHEPLVPLFNNRNRQVPVRITSLRHLVEDLDFVVKHIPGKQKPEDYMSRHPMPIAGLAPEERDAQMVDEGEDIIVMRVMCDSLPPAITQEMIRQAETRMRTSGS